MQVSSIFDLGLPTDRDGDDRARRARQEREERERRQHHWRWGYDWRQRRWGWY